MPYSTRNALYLRISSWTVLPLYLYLDERHVSWMTDETLQRALADLRPMLLKKFHAEDPQMVKKSTVEVHRGATYQFAFFFRKTDTRHVVLLKKREYVPRAISRAIKRQPEPTPPPPKRRRATKTPARAASKTPARATSRTPARASSRTPFALDLLVSPDPSSPLPLDEPEPAPARQSNPLFLPSDEPHRSPPLVAVKPEPLDDLPRIPIRSEEERREMYAGASESLNRTSMDTGFEDPAGDDDVMREREGSEELVSFRAVVDDDEDEAKDVKSDVKPELRLSYKGFSIASRHLVLIIEPYPAFHAPSTKQSRARSTYSRSMSRATAVERDTTALDSATPFRGDTPLVPNSRRGGTGSVRPTPTPFSDRQTPIPNSRGGGRIQSATPLFRDMTPMSAFGDAAPPSRGGALFDDGGSSDEEETEWRKRARQGSYAPWRGASVMGGEDGAAPSSGRRPVDSDDSDDIDDLDGEGAGDSDDDEEVAQAKRLMALSQRLQGNTEGRTGAAGGGTAVDAGELGGGDEDDAFGEGDDGFDEDVGGADA